MQKNSTLFSIASIDVRNEKGLNEKALQDNHSFPREAVLANIISFSKALKIERSRETGLIEIVLN